MNFPFGAPGMFPPMAQAPAPGQGFEGWPQGLQFPEQQQAGAQAQAQQGLRQRQGALGGFDTKALKSKGLDT